MNNTVQLSYSTINNCLQPNSSHNWINKLSFGLDGKPLKPEDHDYYHEGKAAHDVIQKHISGKLIDPRLESLNGLVFPITEEKDFDERCKFTFHVKPLASAEKDLLSKELEVGSGIYTTAVKNEYRIIGYVDAYDHEHLRIGEIKSSSAPWSLGKFQKSMQRKLYALAHPSYKELIGITCQRDMRLWDNEKPKFYKIPLTENDRKEALEWVVKGIQTLEAGDYTGGLEDGRCKQFRCYFGKNCQFKYA